MKTSVWVMVAVSVMNIETVSVTDTVDTAVDVTVHSSCVTWSSTWVVE